jgi:uncharacterized protein (DUF2062 family)
MLKRFLPTRESLTQTRFLRFLGPRIHAPLIWHINRRAVCRGMAVGAFFGLLIPIAQIPAAAIAALLLRANLWIAAVATLVSNPLTYAPIYYFAYRLGARLLGLGVQVPPAAAVPPEPAGPIQWLAETIAWLAGIGGPLLLGVVLIAVSGGVLAYVLTRIAWRTQVLMRRRRQLALRRRRVAAPT